MGSGADSLRILLVGANHRAEIRSATVAIHGLARVLRDRGHDVTLLQAARPEHQVRIEGVRTEYTTHTQKSSYPFRFALRRLGRYDVIHANDQSAAFLGLRSRLRALPLAVLFNPPRVRRESFWRTNTRWRYIELAVRCAPVRITPSRWLAGALAERYGLDPGAFHVIPYGVGEQWFRATDGTPRSDGRPARVVAVNMKGVECTLRAFAQVRAHVPATLELYGVHKQTEQYRRLADALGIAHSVRFEGFVANEQLPARLAGADVLMNPTRADNLPQVLLETQALGVPAVTSDVGGVPEIVEHGETGLLCPVDDTEAFAKALEALLTQPALRARMARAARERAARLWRWDAVAARYEQEIYFPLAHSRSLRSGAHADMGSK